MTVSFLVLCLHMYSINAISNTTLNNTEYNFVIHTINKYSNSIIPSRQQLEYYIGTTFIHTISKAFDLNQDTFDLDVDGILNVSSINTEYSFYVSPFIKNTNENYTETELIILFESYIDMQHYYFDEYIYYNFLQQYLSMELMFRNSHPFEMILHNLTWLERTEFTPDDCRNIAVTQIPEDKTENWEDVTNALFHDIYDFLRWIFIGILGLSSIVVIVGYIHSWIVWNYDIYIGNGIFFCFSMFDWYSDILFTFTIPVKYIYLWLISFCLLLIPLIGNVAWLISSQKIWEQDAAIGARVKAWLIRWRPFLYSLTIITGSSFGGINMCNSNMFGYPLFRMGLRGIHLEKFDGKRLFITILGENAPQLILQGYYWFVLNYNFTSDEFNENKLTLGLAMISGIISILYAFGVIYSSKITLSKFNDNECELFEFNIISRKDFPTKDYRKNHSYKYKMYPLRKAFASMFSLELQYVELHPPIKIEYGYQLRFTLQVTQLGGNTAAFKVLKDLIEFQEIPQKIQDVWQLDNLPSITELKWKKNRRRDYQENMVLLQVESKRRPIKKSIENEISISNTFSKNKYIQKQLLQHHEIAALKAPSPNNNSSPAVHSPPVLPWSNIPSYSNAQSQQSPHVHKSNSHHQLHEIVSPPPPHNRNDTTIVHNNMHNMNHNNESHFRIVSDSGRGGMINNKGPGNNEYEDDDEEKEGSITEVYGRNNTGHTIKDSVSEHIPINLLPNNNNVEMISNPSSGGKKHTMSSVSSNKSHGIKKKDTFIYNYNAHSAGILIDYDDDDDMVPQSIINDGILLEHKYDNDEKKMEDLSMVNNKNENVSNDLRSQAMSVISTGSEALFQQQLLNHIKNKNTFSTKI